MSTSTHTWWAHHLVWVHRECQKNTPHPSSILLSDSVLWFMETIKFQFYNRVQLATKTLQEFTNSAWSRNNDTESTPIPGLAQTNAEIFLSWYFSFCLPLTAFNSHQWPNASTDLKCLITCESLILLIHLIMNVKCSFQLFSCIRYDPLGLSEAP